MRLWTTRHKDMNFANKIQHFIMKLSFCQFVIAAPEYNFHHFDGASFQYLTVDGSSKDNLVLLILDYLDIIPIYKDQKKLIFKRRKNIILS